MMDGISQNSNFAKRVKTLKEINFNFSLHSHNEVKICASQENTFCLSLEDKNKVFI
jgi:hypothetical protein